MKKLSLRCAHPLKAFRIGYHPTGKPKYKVVPFETYALLQIDDDKYVCVDQSRARNHNPKSLIMDYVEIPCGHCIYCHLRYSKNWADRCLLEAKYHKDNWFLTLTYDNDHIPTHQIVSQDTGEILDVHSLQIRDVQLFIKRLRKEYNECKIRYFLAGEYGSQTYRPHYHMIAFGLSLNDLQLYKRLPSGSAYYNSERLNAVWQNGHVVIAKADWNSIAYTARYVTKKAYGEKKDLYDDIGLAREFCTMSRRPGIGFQYYQDHPECVTQEFINVATLDGGRKFRPPRYFRKKYDEIWESQFPELYESKKESDYLETLEKQKQIRDLLSAQTDLSYLELLSVQEENELASKKGLERNKI